MRKGKIAKHLEKRRSGSRPLIVCAALVLAAAFFLSRQTTPFYDEYAKVRGEEIAVSLISEAVCEVMNDGTLSGCELMHMTFSPDGSLQTLSADAASVNFLKSSVTKRLSEKLSQEYHYEVKMPPIKLFGSSLSDRAKIAVTFSGDLTGCVHTDFYSDLSHTGDKTIHRLYIDVNAKLIMISGGRQQPINVSDRVLIGETVIAGSVSKSSSDN